MITLTVNETNLYQAHRIVMEHFEIGIPAPQLTTIEVPGRNGKLDMSEALTGYTTYHNREIEIVLGLTGAEQEIETKRLALMNLLSSKNCRLSFSHLSGYFEGRCTVTSISREPSHYTVTIQYDCFPYRYLAQGFHQERMLSHQPVTMSCLCLVMPVVPTIETTGNATIKHKTSTFTVQNTHFVYLRCK